MSTPEGTTSIVYHYEKEILNRSKNVGEGLGRSFPMWYNWIGWRKLDYGATGGVGYSSCTASTTHVVIRFISEYNSFGSTMCNPWS